MGIQTGKVNILSTLHEWFQLLESGHDISAVLRLQEAFDSLACSADWQAMQNWFSFEAIAIIYYGWQTIEVQVDDHV